jgi:hypothetical protein
MDSESSGCNLNIVSCWAEIEDDQASVWRSGQAFDAEPSLNQRVTSLLPQIVKSGVGTVRQSQAPDWGMIEHGRIVFEARRSSAKRSSICR